MDRIQDTSVAGEENEVLFGPGISPDQLVLGLVSDSNVSYHRDLELKVGQTGDVLVFDAFDSADALGPRTIQTLDSGGPPYVSLNGKLYVAGITSRMSKDNRVMDNGKEEYYCTKDMIFTFVPPLTKWITDNSAAMK